MPPNDDQDRAGDNAAFEGSSSRTSAIATEKSGAVPTVTDVREGPASRIASVKRSCEHPGPSTPASRNGQTPARSRSPAAANGNVTNSAAAIVNRAPELRVGHLREREAERDRHRTEERGRDESEHDRVHARTLLPCAVVADPRIRELAELLVNRSLDVQPGWQVLDPGDAARPAAPDRGRGGDRPPRGVRAVRMT